MQVGNPPLFFFYYVIVRKCCSGFGWFRFCIIRLFCPLYAAIYVNVVITSVFDIIICGESCFRANALYVFHLIITELNRYGGPGDGEATTSPASESKQGGAFSKSQSDAATTLAPPLPHSDIYHSGIPSQRTSISLQRPGQRPHQKWKGPDKISRIYGDWIDDFE